MVDDALVTEVGDNASEVVHEPETEYGAIVSYSRGQKVLHPARGEYLKLAEALHADGFLMCVDVTAVDYLTFADRSLPAGVAAERFEVVASFIDHRAPRRVRVRVQVPEHEPVVASLFDLYPGTEALEREAFDMFGVDFEGHPDMTRILMPEDWVGHPLRKDFNSGRIPVQFKDAPAGG